MKFAQKLFRHSEQKSSSIHTVLVSAALNYDFFCSWELCEHNIPIAIFLHASHANIFHSTTVSHPGTIAYEIKFEMANK